MVMRKGWHRWLAVAIAVAGGMLAVGGVLAATVTCVSNFEVDLESHSFNLDGTSTWTYTVLLLQDIPYALSHQSIEIDPDCVIIDPEDGDTYTTGPFVFTVEWGKEQYFGEEALKFEVQGEGPKHAGDLVTFTLTIEGAKVGQAVPGTQFTMKYGTLWDTALEEGPICEPTAVQLTSVRGESGAQAVTLFALLVTGLVVAGAGAWELRRLQH